jgi:hypothetical protein
MNREKKALLDLAFRTRAGGIAILQSCLCAYPLELHPTSTGHDECCPAHGMMIAFLRIDRSAA